VQKASNTHTAVLVFPFVSPNVFSFAEKLATVVSSVATYTVLISGGVPNRIIWPSEVQVLDIGVRLHHIRERHPVWLSVLLWLGKVVLAQIRLAKGIHRLRHEVDIVICSLGCYYQLPILMARLLKKKVVSSSMGPDSLKAKKDYGNVIAAFISLLTRFNFALSHAVLVESLRLGSYKDLVPFRSKLCNGALFLEDFDRFRVQTPVQKRKCVIGYVGRLVAEKGVMEFVQAIPLALEQRPDLQFLIIGTGRLDEVLETAIHGQSWAAQARWLKWVEHEHIPDYLNMLKLLVMPSYAEGVPNLALEAMGCGTPILATGVGGIPDLIVDGETGFLLTDHSPNTIARAIIYAVNDPRLESMTQQARALIECDYSLDASSKRYGAIMEKLSRASE
jgi:glycosyltransferase involved in cell wall biosynthesis